jgi:GNAT superfamily N-acetyltransferase
MTSNTGSGEATLRTLRAGEASQVGDVIADSHSDYPSFTYLFPDPRQRGRVLKRLMTGVTRDAVAFDEVHVAVVGERIVGAAVWLPPGAFPWTRWRKIKATSTFFPLLWQTPPVTSEFFALGANAEKAAPVEPHWNLQVLGIRREAQGQGLGSRLVQRVLAGADREGRLCYLETADPTNLDFYKRLGFDFDRRHHLIPDGPPHYSMRRPSRPLIPEGRP